MLKKFLLLILSLVTFSLVTAGCGGSETAEKAVEQGKLAMAGGDYNSALNYFNLAVSEGNTDAKIKETVQTLDNFLKAREELANHQSTKALEYLNAIPAGYITNSAIAAEIENLRKEIDQGTSSAANINEQIAAVRNWIASGDYASAELNINELFTKPLSDDQRKQAEELRATLQTAQEKISQATQAAADQARQQRPQYDETYMGTYATGFRAYVMPETLDFMGRFQFSVRIRATDGNQTVYVDYTLWNPPGEGVRFSNSQGFSGIVNSSQPIEQNIWDYGQRVWGDRIR